MGKPKSGYKKRKEKEKKAEYLESQKGAIDKFVSKKPKLSSGNQSGDADSSSLALAIVPYIDPRDGQTETENNVEVEEDHINLNMSPVEKETDSDANEDRKSDIDANELYVELKLLRDFIPKGNMGPVEVLSFLKRHDCFPNASIAYRVLLTIPVTVASAERSFSKLKLLKSYMRTTMTQQRLNDLATISLESEVLKKIDYEEIIEDFISKNPKRMMLFK